MTDKQIIDNINNFCLVCYYDNKTNELVHIEQYNDNDTSIHSDIESYKYGYNAEIVKPEQLIRQLDQLKIENEELKKTINDLLNKPKIQDKIIWKIDNKALLGSKDAYIYKLQKTLTEIKEMLKKGAKIHDDIIVNKSILQKCEVLKDE